MDVKMIKTGLLQANTYIVSEENLCLVIDPGDELNKINDYLRAKQMQVKAVLLTHGHYDHIGVADQLAQQEKCNIYASFFEQEILEDPIKNGSKKLSNKLISLKNVVYFKQEIILKIGNFEVEVVFLPGHTPGGVGYLIGDAIFTGDTMFKGTYGRVDLYGGDHKKMQESLKYLLSLRGDLKVFSGHGDITTIGEERLNY